MSKLTTFKPITVHRQHGITLIMVLVFVVTLSLIAAVGLRGVISGERVGANERDKALAFQAAESAAREGSAIVANSYNAAASAADKKLTTPGVVSIAAPGHPLGGNAEFWRNTSSLDPVTSCATVTDNTKRFDWSLTACSNEASNDYKNKVKPRFVIEKLNAVQAATPSKTDCWYRITSRATGGSGTADIILQLMFAQTKDSLPAGALAACN